jgi:class 3 adenylate cyclase
MPARHKPPEGTAVSTIAEWLGSLGLAEYEQRFAENDIDVSVLPHLTEQHLERLGISLGHRLKMLAAIAQLAGASPPSAAPQPAPAHEAKPQDTAERRQLTVMFCDLVGSTALSARLDPEDLRSIIGTYHRCCADLIGKAGAFVAKYMGDGVLAFFGYPRASEQMQGGRFEPGWTRCILRLTLGKQPAACDYSPNRVV